MAGQFIDFAAVKNSVTMEQAIQFLGLKMKREGEQFRSPCPQCARGGDRALVVTPSKMAFYCFGAKRGGDVIALVAHINGTNQREAATMLQEQYCNTSTASTSSTDTSSRSTSPESPPAGEKSESLQPLAHLTTDHPAIEALGLTPDICNALGIGYAAKGVMRGRVAFPLRLPDGTLIGYQGLATSPDQAPLILFPRNLAEKVSAPPKAHEKPKASADDLRKLFRVVA